MNMQTIVERNPSTTTRMLPDGHICIIKDEKVVHSLSPLAGIIWEFCDGRNTLESIVDQLSEVAGVEPSADVIANVETLINDLVAAELVKVKS